MSIMLGQESFVKHVRGFIMPLCPRSVSFARLLEKHRTQRVWNMQVRQNTQLTNKPLFSSIASQLLSRNQTWILNISNSRNWTEFDPMVLYAIVVFAGWRQKLKPSSTLSTWNVKNDFEWNCTLAMCVCCTENHHCDNNTETHFMQHFSTSRDDVAELRSWISHEQRPTKMIYYCTDHFSIKSNRTEYTISDSLSYLRDNVGHKT